MVGTDPASFDLVPHLVEIGEEPLEEPAIVVLALAIPGQSVLQVGEHLEQLQQAVVEVAVRPAPPDLGEMLVGEPSIHRTRVDTFADPLEEKPKVSLRQLLRLLPAGPVGAREQVRAAYSEACRTSMRRARLTA
jgi:hypothetical protein